MGKKVCILTSVHPALDVRIFYKEARTLKNAGYEVVLIARHAKDEIKEGVKIVALANPGNRFVRILITTWKTFKLAFKENVDIYHFHDPELILAGLFLKIFKHTKVIYDVHEDVELDIISKYWIPRMLRLPVAKIFNLLEKKVSKKFDCIITATFHIRDKFKNAIDIRNYPPLIELPEVKKKGCRLIYIGGISEERGIGTMIEALEFIPQARLILAGEIARGFKLKHCDRVEYRGCCLHEEVFKYIFEADIGMVCLHPTISFIRALPIKMFEYMTVGLPVVASNFPLWKEIIEGNRCGICVDPLNPKEIAGAIEYLIKHTDEARKMGENGRRTVLEKYNWENESKKLLEVYRHLS